MQDEKLLKRFLKRRCKVTLAFVTAFLITGSLTMASEADPLFPKDKDTEILFFLNGGFGNGELESVKNIGQVKLIPGDDTIKPPIEWTPIGPSESVNPEEPETIPGIGIIKPGEVGGPITKPTDPERPQGQEIINTENKMQENGIVFNIKENEKFVNKGKITYKSDVELIDTNGDGFKETFNKEAYVIKNNGGTIINEGNIKVEGSINTKIKNNAGEIIDTITTGEGAGIYQIAGTFENKATIHINGNGYDTDKDGYIDGQGGTGVLIKGGKATNNGTIKGNPGYIIEEEKLVMYPFGIGMDSKGGIIENETDGVIENLYEGMKVTGSGTAINNGIIQSVLTGISAINGGTAINNGTINATEITTGQTVFGLFAGDYSGKETLITNTENGNVTGSVKVIGPTAKIINEGTINGDAYVEMNGTFQNNGTLTGEEIKTQTGTFIQGINGKLDVSKFNGDLYLAGDYAENNFSDKISVGDNITIDEHNGEIKSDSVMYDYNSNDKTLERKEFSELLSNKNIANYLEDNYMDGDIIRQELYNNLKDINTVKEFNRATNNLFGNDIYPALNKQTLEMVRFNRDTLYSQVFNKDTDKETRFIGGADYKTFDVDSSNLSGYDTDIQSVFIGMDKQISENNRMGGIVNIGKMKSTFEMNNAERDDMFFQANLYNIYQKDNWKLVNNLFFGLTDGDLERDLKFGDVYGRQSADIDSTYIGLNNVLTRRFDFNSFYVTPKLEANLTQLMNSEIQEEGNYGLEIEKQDVTSIEAGIGFELGKDFMLTDTLKAGIKLSGTYLAELSDPYEEVNVRLRQINHSEYVKISEYDNEDYKDISLRLELSNDSISSYAEYKYMFDDSIGTLGVSYKF